MRIIEGKNWSQPQRDGRGCVHRVANASPRCLVCMAGREDFTARGKNTGSFKICKASGSCRSCCRP